MKKNLMAICCSLALTSTLASANELITDGGFDEPTLSDGMYTTSSSYWSFNGVAGIWNITDNHQNYYPNQTIDNVLFVNEASSASYNLGNLLLLEKPIH